MQISSLLETSTITFYDIPGVHDDGNEETKNYVDEKGDEQIEVDSTKPPN